MRIPSNRGYTFHRWAFLALLGTVAFTAPAARAQPAAGQRYDFIARALPLSSALERLVNETRIDLFYDPPLVEGKRTNCVMQEATAEDLLRCILRDTGLDFLRLSSGLYVITRAPETPPRFGRLRGIVMDAETGQPLPNAHVMLAEASAGTTSNEAGMFAFSRLRPGRYQVIAQFVGYRPSTTRVEVPPDGDTEARLSLHSEPVLVAPIVIDGMQWRLPSAGLGQSGIDGDEIGQAPAPGGDVLFGLGTLPGVRVNDATADIHIQGGETGEHQIRLDGAPVFLPLSFAPFVGPFSPFAVGDITVNKAGFPAAKGSQISGTIDIAHELSVAETNRLDVQVDPLSVNARAFLRRGQPNGVQTTLMVAGRGSLWKHYRPPALEELLDRWNTPDPFLKAAFYGTQFNVEPNTARPNIGFNDLHAAGRVRFGLLQSLYASLYLGTSHLGTASDDPVTPTGLRDDAPADGFTDGFTDGLAATPVFRDDFTWKTGVFQTRYESVLDARTFVSARLRGSLYHVSHHYDIPPSQNDETPVLPDTTEGNRIYELGAEVTLDHALSDRQNVEGGIEFVQTSSRFSVQGTQAYQIRHESASWRLAGFVHDEIRLTDGLMLDVGGRVTFIPPHASVYTEPRATLRLDRASSPAGPWSARVSVGRYHQFSNQFDVSSRSPGALVSSTRFWLVADSTIRPPAATHVAAEWLLRPSADWTLRLEAYRKWQHHILTIDYAADVATTTSELAQDAFITGITGTVNGYGVQLRRRLGPGRAEVRYEYSMALRDYSGTRLYQGRRLPAPWNEPHRLELMLDVMPLQNLTFLTRWRGIWGREWAFRQSYYDFVVSPAFDAGQPIEENVRNQIEEFDLRNPASPANHLPPIYQLDVSLAYARRVGLVVLQARADVLNVLDRQNVAERHLVFDAEQFYDFENPNSGFLLLADRPLLPRVVTLALRMSW